MRGDKALGVVRHLKMPLELDEQLRLLAALERRPVTEQILLLLDEAVNGSRTLRLAHTAPARSG